MNTVANHSDLTSREDFSLKAREHHRELLVYARALCRVEVNAHDLTQEAFITAWKNWDKFDATRDFGAWMRGIIRNKWREFIRKNRPLLPLEQETLELMESTMNDWKSARIDGGPPVFVKLEQCIDLLPQTMRAAIELTYNQGMKSKDAANNLSTSAANLRKRLERARKKLKSCLKGTTAHES